VEYIYYLIPKELFFSTTDPLFLFWLSIVYTRIYIYIYNSMV
jgi:hypothetical protein